MRGGRGRRMVRGGEGRGGIWGGREGQGQEAEAEEREEEVRHVGNRRYMSGRSGPPQLGGRR
jgi:hypothetical protein